MVHLKKEFETDAILLRRVEYGDSDLIVELFTESSGIVSCMAKSARKSRKRFQSSLDYFALLNVKISETSSSGLAYVNQARLIQSYAGVASDMSIYCSASGLVEMVRKLAPERQPDQALFETLKHCLGQLSESGFSWKLCAAVDLMVLDALGLAPRLNECSGCSKKAPDGAPAGFDPARGIICKDCGKGEFRISGQAREGLIIAAGSEAFEKDSGSEFSEQTWKEARKVLDAFMTYQLGGPLCSRSVI